MGPRLALLLFPFALWCGTSGRAADGVTPAVIRVGIEPNAEPFMFADAQGKPTGFACDLLRAVAADQKLELEFVLKPWNGILDDFKAGHIDAICNMVDTPERRTYVDFSATTILMKSAVYTRRNAPLPSHHAQFPRA